MGLGKLHQVFLVHPLSPLVERRTRERLDVGANDQLARAIWAPRKPALLGPFPSVGQSETIPLLYGRLKVEAAAERRIVLEPTPTLSKPLVVC